MPATLRNFERRYGRVGSSTSIWHRARVRSSPHSGHPGRTARSTRCAHPDSREVTILTGVFATGYGETFDSAKPKILPAGSFYTEPANVPHYIEIKEDTVLQVSGTGPSARKFVNPSDNPK
jgi:hypothetical protein